MPEGSYDANDALQAKAALGVKPASHARLGHRLISRAEKKGEEPTKSENKDKVEKAEKGSDKGSQVVEKVICLSTHGHAATVSTIAR